MSVLITTTYHNMSLEQASALEQAAATIFAKRPSTVGEALEELKKKEAAPVIEDEGEELADDFGGEEDEEEIAPKKTKKKKAVTRDDVIDALRAYAEEHSKEKAVKVLEKVGGVKSALKLDESKFEKVIDALAI